MGMLQNDTSPPASPEDEKGALGCILLEGEQVSGGGIEKLGQLVASDFHDLRNRSIFSVLVKLQNKGDQLSTINVIKKLDGEVETPYVANLANETSSQWQFPEHLREIKEASARRKLRVIGQRTVERSSDMKQPVDGVLTDLQEEVQKAANFSGSGLPEIENIMDFMARDIPKPPELIKGLLHQGSKMLISGGSKSFKTWTLFDLSLSVASGTPFLGLPTTQAKVLFLNLELQDPFSQERSKEVFRAKGLSEVRNMEILNLRGHVYDIKKLRQQVMPRLLKGDIGLVIIDPIYKIYGDRDENSVSDIASLMYELECICREGKCAIVFAAHQTKGNQSGKESIDRISGSGAFARDVDSGLIFTAHSDEWCYTADASILRNFPPLKPFVVRWEYPLMVREDALNPEHLKPQRNGNPPKHHSVEEIMAHVPHDKPIDKNELRGKASKAKIALNKINPLIDQAVEEGLLYVHLIPRSRTCPKKQLARYRQEQQGDFHDSHDTHS
jgi:hypothetical protein